MSWVIPPWEPPALPVAGGGRFPVRRVYCIGRNYAAHTREMGGDPVREPPFFFQKNPDDLTTAAEIPYPPMTAELHHEVEMVVALGEGGTDIPEAEARAHILGYAVGLDMTRRDLQAEAKALRRPWEVGKAFAASGPVGVLHTVSAVGHPETGAITLAVNGALRQSGDLAQMIWTVPEQIAVLSRHFTLAAGDVIFTGTPAGVGPVARGDALEARVEGLGALTVRVV